MAAEAIDPFVQLALMAKAKLVFESDDTFLSFPALISYSYAPSDLKFTADSISTAHDLARLSEFARITNQIPRGVLAPMEEGEYLWDICSEALLLGDPASGSLSASDQARLDAARAVLYAAGDGGRLQDSPTVVAYKQYRDVQFAALQDYRNAQFTAEASTDPAVKSQWTTVDEPRLRQAVQAAEGAWETVGCKAKVEEAMQVEQACAARNPQMEWNAWKTDFLGDIDLETDTDRIRFAPTLFTPSNVFDSAWGRFTLTADEMAHLASAAPPELTDIFGTMPAGDVQSVSFEYRSVALTRPWLPKRLFQSRFWRLGTGGGELSDGAQPSATRCPAYITALVFARNVQVTYRQIGGGKPPPPRSWTLLTLNPTQLRTDSTQLKMARFAVAPAASGTASTTAAPVAKMLQAARPMTLQASFAASAPAPAAATTSTAGAAPAMAFKPAVLQPRLAAALARTFRPDGNIIERGPVVRDHRVPPVVRDHRVPVTTTQPEAPPAADPPSPVAADPPPPVASSPIDTAPPDQVTILAFICRRVKKCPDPDPSLTWV